MARDRNNAQPARPSVAGIIKIRKALCKGVRLIRVRYTNHITVRARKAGFAAIAASDLHAFKAALRMLPSGSTGEPTKLATAAVRKEAKPLIKWLAVVYGTKGLVESYKAAAREDNTALLDWMMSPDGFGYSSLALGVPVVYNQPLRQQVRLWLAHRQRAPPSAKLQRQVLAAVKAHDAAKLRTLSAAEQFEMTYPTAEKGIQRACLVFAKARKDSAVITGADRYATLDLLHELCSHDLHMLRDIHEHVVSFALRDDISELLEWSVQKYPDICGATSLFQVYRRNALATLQRAYELGCPIDLRLLQVTAVNSGNLSVLVWARKQQQAATAAAAAGAAAAIYSSSSSSTDAQSAASDAQKAAAAAAEFDEILYTAAHCMGQTAIERWLRDKVFAGRGPNLLLVTRAAAAAAAADVAARASNSVQNADSAAAAVDYGNWQFGRDDAYGSDTDMFFADDPYDPDNAVSDW